MSLELESFEVYRGENEEEEICLYIEADYHPKEPAITSGPPDRWDPGTPEEMEITKVELKVPLFGPFRNIDFHRYAHLPWDGKLTEEEKEYAIEQLFEIVQGQYEEAMDARAESAMEAREARYYDQHGY